MLSEFVSHIVTAFLHVYVNSNVEYCPVHVFGFCFVFSFVRFLAIGKSPR